MVNIYSHLITISSKIFNAESECIILAGQKLKFNIQNHVFLNREAYLPSFFPFQYREKEIPLSLYLGCSLYIHESHRKKKIIKYYCIVLHLT